MNEYWNKTQVLGASYLFRRIRTVGNHFQGKYAQSILPSCVRYFAIICSRKQRINNRRIAICDQLITDLWSLFPFSLLSSIDDHCPSSYNVVNEIYKSHTQARIRVEYEKTKNPSPNRRLASEWKISEMK